MKIQETSFERRKRRTRYKLKKANPNKARLSIFCSNRYIFAQVIDDKSARTLAAASSLEKDLRDSLKSTLNVAASAQVGALIAKRALEKGITTVVFDRGGHAYHGRLKALAESARQAGLQF
jgi:large subunit ribosomal protein L18